MGRKAALVSGGNRGLGWEICRQLSLRGVNVVLGARNAEEGAAAARRLKTPGGAEVVACRLDIRRPDSVKEARDFALKRFGTIDILVNNAGVFLDASPVDEGLGANSIFAAKAETILETFETNALGSLRLCQAVIPGMRERDYGRVVNVSSGDAQLCEMSGGRPAYRISKVSLNALTLIFAGELRGTNVLVNSVCPGWMKTRMGGPLAKRTTEKGAETVVWLALHPDGGPQGGFFRDMAPLPW